MEIEVIQNKIYEIRGVRVMLDFDLAQLYGIETRVLKQAVRRNLKRFSGDDFMFEPTADELSRSQFVTLNTGRGSNIKYLPFAFTELGIAMLSSVLNSDTAIEINKGIMRTFVAMRNYITTTSTLSAELAELRAKLELLERADEDTLVAVNDLSEDVRKEIEIIYEAIAALSIKPPELPKPRNRIGFKSGEE